MMRILMVGPVPFLYGGISKVAGAFLKARKPGLKMDYAATSTKRFLIFKIAVFVSGAVRILLKLMLQRPDAVHIHFSKGASIYRKYFVLKMCRLFQVPVVVQSHTFLPEIEVKHLSVQKPDFYTKASSFGKKVISLFMDEASGILVLSERIKLSIQPITRNENVWVLRNPVDCQKHRPSIKADSPLNVLFMGDFSERKGIKILVKAASEVLDRLEDVKFILCGKAQENIKEIVEDWGIQDHVELPGFVSGKKKQKCFAKAHVFVLPSYEEGLPVAILEAMCSGLPILTTPVGGIPDVLKEYSNALFIKPGDHRALAEKIIFLLENEDVRKKIGENNRKKVLDEFDTSVIMQDLVNIYRKLTES
ncbi:MAG: glycosyltransferase [Candidatus Aminicenantes bacterium]|nr:glycosyltransferase [Candidatus Aminicenantes bacterium]